ncbi:hypothetical protein [uncultured Anaeromusa sp.]|uniref:hypothetical protein n=1 Tax=uncultured Anaeromusa sp. TaxID=673273 RepID=UPI0029C640F6|nr:hypothetical protein [uncultured Anaeromusa sp.]
MKNAKQKGVVNKAGRDHFPRSGYWLRQLAAICLPCGVYVSESNPCKRREKFLLSVVLADFINRIMWGSVISLPLIGLLLLPFVAGDGLLEKTIAIWLFIIPLIPGAFHILFIGKIPANLPEKIGTKALHVRIHFLIFSTFLLYLLPMLYEMATQKLMPFLYF